MYSYGPPTYGQAKAGWPTRTYIQQLNEDTGCSPEDLPKAMNDREKWRERVRDIRASGTTWWWWFNLALPVNLYHYDCVIQVTYRPKVILSNHTHWPNHSDNISFHQSPLATQSPKYLFILWYCLLKKKFPIKAFVFCWFNLMLKPFGVRLIDWLILTSCQPSCII